MSTRRLAGSAVALVAAALIGGTLINAVAAAPMEAVRRAEVVAPAEPSPGSSGAPARAAGEPGPYCLAYRAALAKNLSVSEDELVAASKAAIGTAVDQAVADGSLTKAAADRLKARVAASEADGCGILSGRGGKVAAKALAVAKDGLAAAAEAMDMTVREVRVELRAGKSLKDVATAANVPYETVSAAVMASVKQDVDAAVAAGTIKQARADRILARLEQRLADGWAPKAR